MTHTGNDYLAVCFLIAASASGRLPRCLPAPSEDAVQFFRNINVTPDQPVKDAVCFFCSVRVEGNVNGDIVVFFGNVRLNGQAHHDVVNFFGSVPAADNSSIGGDLVSFFGYVRLGENVSVRRTSSRCSAWSTRRRRVRSAKIA